MFGIEGAINALICAQAMYEHEREAEKRFAESIAHLPADQQAYAIRIRREVKERMKREAVIERRHQELCAAIRDARPRGIGIFL